MVLALLLVVTMPMMAERVTPETAHKVATTFLNNNGAKTTQLSDLSKEVGFQNLYIFTTEQSFVVMAADDCVQPILGYSLTGKFVAEDMPENVSGWLQGYNDEIQYAIDQKAKPSAEVAQQWKDLVAGKSEVAQAEAVVNPLIQTSWGQDSPFNLFCPGGKSTGCVATAMAQIMKYWGYPTTGFTSHSYTPTTHPDYGEQTALFGETTYDWDNMILSYLNGYNEVERDAVATLMYHCGVSVNMDYGSNGSESSAVTADVAHALTSYFNYSQTVQYIEMADYVNQNGEPDLEQWESILKAELDAQRPVQYKGRKSSGGHSFICDGYNTEDKFHFNWGWSGNNDGWFTIMGISYSTEQAAIIGIKPIQSAAHAPTDLVPSVSGNNVTLGWTVGDNAVSYNIYRNHDSIDNTSTNTFIDRSLPVGQYMYYVRGVDVDGNVTLPTNAVTAQVKFNYSLENVTLDHLEASYQDGLVSLQWEAPFRLNYLDYYTWDNDNIANTGIGSARPFYWGARFLASMLDNGTSLSSVATYFYTSGTYTASVYQCTGANPNGTPIRTITDSYEKGWTVIPIEPFTIDVSKDLWVVFSSSDIVWSTLVALQSSEDGNYYSTNGTNWHHFNTGYSFFITAGLTIGDFSYTLYDNGQSIATNLASSAYSPSNRSSDGTHLYTVRAFYNNEATPMSNMAGFALGTASLNSLELGKNDKLTITEGSKLTVSGTLTDTIPDNLILENGAQLIHSSDDVQATVLKDIAPYTTDSDGWNFIASPVTESFAPRSGNGFLNGSSESNVFDLYYYNEPTYLWKNYEAESFDIEHKKGYLYANGKTEGTTLLFVGTLLPSNTEVSISNLSYQATRFNGFNLVGNPFACNATIDQDCYVIEGNHVVLATGTKVFAPCEGAFVKATSTNNYAVTFSKNTGAKANGNGHCLDLVVTQGKATTDRARVRFGEGIGLEKFSLDDQDSKISLWQNGQDYAVAYADGVSEMPISFVAAQDATYTLHVENNRLDLDYLHLIDNMTGVDVDLLTTPSYTFEAKYSDYPLRFRLVFAPEEDGASTGSATFAYYANGEIIIISDACNASVQVVDMMGRVITTRVGRIQCVPTSGITPGVYVLRLIDGETVRTQKIVIE